MGIQQINAATDMKRSRERWYERGRGNQDIEGLIHFLVLVARD